MPTKLRIAYRLRTLMRTVVLAGLALVLAAATAPAAAADEPPAYIAEVVPHARLAGEGRFRYWGFHVYDGRLWVGDAGYRPDAPLAAPFALDLKYARDFKGEDIVKTTRDEWDRLGLGSAAQRDKWIADLKPIMPDVKPDQHLTGAFIPGTGMRLFSNGKPVGEVRDLDFAKAFFAIWLDPRTKAGAMREAMLSGAAPR